jgi:hypothetical protein
MDTAPAPPEWRSYHGRTEEEMRWARKLITTISLVVALATVGVASTASAAPNNTPPKSPGVCNMFHVGDSTVGFAGMDNSSHGQGYGYDEMFDLVVASGCLS